MKLRPTCRRVGEIIRTVVGWLRARTWQNLVVLTVVCVIAAVIAMVVTQNRDAYQVRRPNFSLGKVVWADPGYFGGITSLFREGPGEPWSDNHSEGWEQAVCPHVALPNNRWGLLLVTGATFDPESLQLSLRVHYTPGSTGLPDWAHDSPLWPLQYYKEAWILSPYRNTLTPAHVQADGSDLEISFPIRRTASPRVLGTSMWPFDKYDAHLYLVFRSPSGLDPADNLTAKFAEGVGWSWDGTEWDTAGFDVLPVGVGCAERAAFSAPSGYHLTIGAGANSKLGAPYLSIHIDQTLLFPKVGFFVVLLLFMGILSLASFRITRGGNPLEISGIILALVFGTTLAASLLGEPSVPWPTAVDVLRFIVIVWGLALVCACLLLAMRRPSQK